MNRLKPARNPFTFRASNIYINNPTLDSLHYHFREHKKVWTDIGRKVWAFYFPGLKLLRQGPGRGGCAHSYTNFIYKNCLITKVPARDQEVGQEERPEAEKARGGKEDEEEKRTGKEVVKWENGH